MMTVKVLIDSVEKVKAMSSIISELNVECELVEGIHIVDAKSIMGIFSLDLKKPLQLNIHSDDPHILDNLRDFIVEK
ncbi:MAG: HPr domain-containing protein [Oscillospiraceae bacterium]|jgi:phosphocarrier protein HPr